jgi:hypothetical protein
MKMKLLFLPLTLCATLLVMGGPKPELPTSMCKNGHGLEQICGIPLGYTSAYCNKCDAKKIQNSGPVYHCSSCKYDICNNCYIQDTQETSLTKTVKKIVPVLMLVGITLVVCQKLWSVMKVFEPNHNPQMNELCGKSSIPSETIEMIQKQIPIATMGASYYVCSNGLKLKLHKDNALEIVSTACSQVKDKTETLANWIYSNLCKQSTDKQSTENRKRSAEFTIEDLKNAEQNFGKTFSMDAFQRFDATWKSSPIKNIPDGFLLGQNLAGYVLITEEDLKIFFTTPWKKSVPTVDNYMRDHDWELDDTHKAKNYIKVLQKNVHNMYSEKDCTVVLLPTKVFGIEYRIICVPKKFVHNLFKLEGRNKFQQCKQIFKHCMFRFHPDKVCVHRRCDEQMKLKTEELYNKCNNKYGDCSEYKQ